MQGLIPYKLWHKTGFTQALYSSMQLIENELLSYCVQHFYSLIENFRQLLNVYPCDSTFQAHFPHFDDNSDFSKIWRESPTRHSLEASHLLEFRDNEQKMSLTTSPSGNNWLSCDHTFRSVANIGMIRKSDKGWIKRYSVH